MATNSKGSGPNHSFHNWYSGTAKLPPAISSSTAVVLSVLYVLIYVIPFYLSAKTRPSPSLFRDASTVIRARIRAVTFSCILTCAGTTYIIKRKTYLHDHDILHLYGLWPLSALDIARTFSLTVILFVGPLFESAVVEGQWRPWLRGGAIQETLSTTIGFRNYIAGPVTEEFVFRSMLLTLQILANESQSHLIFITPLYFGIAHIHHCYEFKLTHPKVPLLPALLRTVFQFGYTSIFGFYASFILLRTGNLPAAIITHTFCNWMGLPRFWGRLQAPVALGTADPNQEGEITSVDGSGVVHGNDGSVHLSWTMAYYILLLGGAYGFYTNLWSLTESSNALVHLWA